MKRELTFIFNDLAEYFHLKPYYTHGLGSLKFSSGSSPTVSRMSIYHGNSLTDARCGAIFIPLLHCTFVTYVYKQKRTNQTSET